MDKSVNKIACALPPIIKGGGGHRTILNNIGKLGKHFACCVDLYIQPYKGNDKELVRKEIKDSFDLSFDNIYFDTHIKNGYDIVVASMWTTVDMVMECDCNNKFYFVQDYEPWFYPMGNTRIQAENTYSKGLNHIAFGRWLSNVVREKSGAPAWNIDFCADHDAYCPIEGIKKEKAICAIWQPEKPRRVHELLLEALQILEVAAPELKIYLYGSEQDPPINLTNVEMLGILSIQDCNILYNKCLCGVSLSTSNPSRIPFEMMTSGLPVIELYRENNLYDLPNEGVLLSDANPAALSEAILQLVSDADKREKMHYAGLEYMKERLLEKEASDFVKCIENCIFGLEPNINNYFPSYTDKSIKAGRVSSIVAREVKRQKEALERETAERKGGQTIQANSIRFVYDIPFDGKPFDRYRLAVWREHDQSDISWLKMRKKVSRRAECIWTIPEDVEGTVSYNLHLYKKSGKMDFVGSWTRNIKRTIGKTTVTVNLVPLTDSTGNKRYSNKELSQATKANSRISIDRRNIEKIVLLDTEMDSENQGDAIIMGACNDLFEEILAGKEIRRV